MAHPITYAELHSEDTAAASSFYRQLFDWKVSESATPSGPYFALDTGDGPKAGLLRAAGGPSRWVVYVRVDDVQVATARAVRLGARALVTAEEVPGAGWFSLCLDPAGATFGLWQAKSPA
jgi:uncharacterized protein